MNVFKIYIYIYIYNLKYLNNFFVTSDTFVYKIYSIFDIP